MSALVEPNVSHQQLFLGENRVILSNTSWATYESLLSDLTSRSVPHLTYTQGTLEIMSPLPPHEKINRDIEIIIQIIAAELNIDILSLGSTTFRLKHLELGFEPDSCFYIRNKSIMVGKTKIDLEKDPPDLIIEIDITSGSMTKLPIYAQLEIPEVWRHTGDSLFIYHLVKRNYQAFDTSLSFPILKNSDVVYLLDQKDSLKSSVFLKFLKNWIKQKINP